MQAVERPFARAVHAEKDRFIDAAASAFLASKAIDERIYLEHAAAMVDIAERYDRVAIRVGLWEALRVVSLVVGRKGNWDQLWFFLVRQWVQEHGAEAARETAETTRADLQRVIDKALAPDAEFNPVAVAAAMLKVKNLSQWRAETIARTEVHGAMMFGSERGAAKVAQDEGLGLLKSWLPVSDERTRENHAAMSGHPAIPLDADFVVGGTLMKRPGDPRGEAANCINCRCVLTYRVEK